MFTLLLAQLPEGEQFLSYFPVNLSVGLLWGRRCSAAILNAYLLLTKRAHLVRLELVWPIQMP